MNIQDAIRTEAPITPEVLERLASVARDLHALIGKTTELGELFDAYKRFIFYNVPLDKTNIKEEVGDDKWYDAVFLDVHGWTFEECFDLMIRKLKKRYPNKFNELDAVERDLIGERKILES
jgi:NTP pyrophosphatase (non-canonical NTP hydrolase)